MLPVALRQGVNNYSSSIHLYSQKCNQLANNQKLAAKVGS